MDKGSVRTRRERDLGAMEVVETHLSLLLFVGERVYKLKKPITESFVDLSNRDLRLENCRREVRLNRRLAKDVYRGVVTLPTLSGAAGEPAVLMRRLPADRRLSSLVLSDQATTETLKRVATRLARFHATARTGTDVAAAATTRAISARWTSILEALGRSSAETIPSDVLGEIAAKAAAYVRGRGPLFDTRIRLERIRDGHGDVLADDVFDLPDGPRIIDCLEFEDRLRYVDVVDDCSSLAMDLERLERPDLAEAFLHHYLSLTTDDAPASLVHQYIAYRACVRAMVACIRCSQGDELKRREARQLLAIALRHLELAEVTLVLVGGPPGSGKSTLARALSAATGWTVLRSDAIRRGLDPGAAAPSGFESAAYSRSTTDATYDRMLAEASELLSLGRSVILDATWGREEHRVAASTVAHESAGRLVQLRCQVPLEEAQTRIARRMSDSSELSAATPDIAARLNREFAPWPGSDLIDTAGPRREAVRVALEALSKSA